MAWWVEDFEITVDDLVNFRLSDGSITLELMGFVSIDGPVARFSGCHIQGPGANTVGPSTLRQAAEWVMELLHVDELRIEGAARTSGAGPGGRPAPLVFRRTGHPDPAAGGGI